MHALYDLKETLCRELEEYGKKGGGLSTGTIDVIDKLAHTVKNLNKIIEEEESEASYGMNGRRDSMGRYSRTGGMADQLRRMSYDAPDERTRQKLQSLASEMEMM